ncbi:MAG: hypothetical protein ACQESC_01780 [Nanobdellota archaeon]
MMILYKQLATIIVFVTLVVVVMPANTLAQANDCVQGIDGYCDPSCREVDFDCLSNPNLEGRQSSSNTSSQTTDQHINGLDDTEHTSNENISEQAVIPQFIRDNLRELLISAIALLFFIIAITLFIHVHKRRHGTSQQLRQLQDYVRKVRSLGYSDEQIRSTLKQQGYSHNIVTTVFNSLEEEA